MNVDGDSETKSEEGSHAHDASADITDKDSIELKSDKEISCGTDDDCPAYSWCSSHGRCGSWLDLWFQKPLRLSRRKLITRVTFRKCFFIAITSSDPPYTDFSAQFTMVPM